MGGPAAAAPPLPPLDAEAEALAWRRVFSRVVGEARGHASAELRETTQRLLVKALQAEDSIAAIALPRASPSAAPFLELSGVWAHATALGLSVAREKPELQELLPHAPLLDCLFVAGPSKAALLQLLRAPPKVGEPVTAEPQLLALFPPDRAAKGEQVVKRHLPIGEEFLAGHCLPDGGAHVGAVPAGDAQLARLPHEGGGGWAEGVAGTSSTRATSPGRPSTILVGQPTRAYKSTTPTPTHTHAHTRRRRRRRR